MRKRMCGNETGYAVSDSPLASTYQQVTEWYGHSSGHAFHANLSLLLAVLVILLWALAHKNATPFEDLFCPRYWEQSKRLKVVTVGAVV